MRIASLSPAATEILFALGLEKQIVCTDQFSNFPEEAKSLPHVRDMVKIKPEDVSEFQPDIVLLGTSIQERLAEHLRAVGFSVVHDDPRTINDIYVWIRSLGAIFDSEKKAEELVRSMQEGFNDVKRKAAKLPRKPHIYIEEWPALPDSSGGHQPPFASGNWVPEVAKIAGCEQFPVPAGHLSPEVTLDQVAGWNPEMIVISWCGAGSLAQKELLTDRPGWDVLEAVQSGAVRVIDDSLLNRPGPRLVEGAQRLYGWIFEKLH